MPEHGARCFALGDERGISHTLDSLIPEVFSNPNNSMKQTSQTAGQSPQSQRICPTARPGRGSVSLLAVPDVKVGAVVPFHQPRPIPCGCLGSFPVDSTGMPWGQECVHRKDFPLSALLCIDHKPDQTLALASFHIQEFYQTPFLSHFPGFC